MKEKLKSPVFWTELVVITAAALKLFGVYTIEDETINTIQNVITALFTVFATLNNPDSRTDFQERL